MEKKEKENIMEKGNCFRRTGRVDIEGSLRGSRGPKNTIIDGGKTALNTAFTVDTVKTADTVCITMPYYLSPDKAICSTCA